MEYSPVVCPMTEITNQGSIPTVFALLRKHGRTDVVCVDLTNEERYQQFA